MDPRILNQWRAQGHFTILGSSGSVEVLTAARVHQAGILVISTEDPVSAYVTAQHALQLRPDLDIVARVHWRDEGERLQALGVGEVVWPQMEAGLEILLHSLYRYRKPRNEVDEFVDRVRKHLSFTVAEDVEDILPLEGIGPAPELPVVDIPAVDILANGPNLVPEPVPEEPVPQSSDDS